MPVNTCQQWVIEITLCREATHACGLSVAGSDIMKTTSLCLQHTTGQKETIPALWCPCPFPAACWFTYAVHSSGFLAVTEGQCKLCYGCLIIVFCCRPLLPAPLLESIFSLNCSSAPHFVTQQGNISQRKQTHARETRVTRN